MKVHYIIKGLSFILFFAYSQTNAMSMEQQKDLICGVTAKLNVDWDMRTGRLYILEREKPDQQFLDDFSRFIDDRFASAQCHDRIKLEIFLVNLITEFLRSKEINDIDKKDINRIVTKSFEQKSARHSARLRFEKQASIIKGILINVGVIFLIYRAYSAIS